MHRVYLIAAIISFLFIFAGCANRIIKANPDGTFTAESYSLWTDSHINGLTVSTDGKGAKTFTLQNFSDDKTTGLESFNAALPGIVGEAVKAAIAGVKP